jgi:hypothetical protein
MNTIIRKLLPLLLLAAPVMGHAGLIGQEITASYRFPDVNSVYASASFTPDVFTVGAGQESTGDLEGVTTFHVDFGDDFLNITLNTILGNPTWNGTSFNGIVFVASLPHGILSATVDAATTMPGLDNSHVSFDADEIFVNWAGLSYVDGSVVRLNFGFEQGTVPLPGSLSLFGLGLLGLGCLFRSRVSRNG